MIHFKPKVTNYKLQFSNALSFLGNVEYKHTHLHDDDGETKEQLGMNTLFQYIENVVERQTQMMRNIISITSLWEVSKSNNAQIVPTSHMRDLQESIEKIVHMQHKLVKNLVSLQEDIEISNYHVIEMERLLKQKMDDKERELKDVKAKLEAQKRKAAKGDGRDGGIKSPHRVRRPSPRAVAPSPTGTNSVAFICMDSFNVLYDLLSVPLVHNVVHTFTGTLRKETKAWGGLESKFEGDTCIVGFNKVGDCIRSCIAIQLGLLEASWPKELVGLHNFRAVNEHYFENGMELNRILWKGLKAKIGFGYGEIISTTSSDGRSEFVGSVVNTAARVCAEALGGEILTTLATYNLLMQEEEKYLKSHCYVHSVGYRKLKGVQKFEHLFSIVPLPLRNRNFAHLRTHDRAHLDDERNKKDRDDDTYHRIIGNEIGKQSEDISNLLNKQSHDISKLETEIATLRTIITELEKQNVAHEETVRDLGEIIARELTERPLNITQLLVPPTHEKIHTSVGEVSIKSLFGMIKQSERKLADVLSKQDLLMKLSKPLLPSKSELSRQQSRRRLLEFPRSDSKRDFEPRKSIVSTPGSPHSPLSGSPSLASPKRPASFSGVRAVARMQSVIAKPQRERLSMKAVTSTILLDDISKALRTE